jgi:hypothetical protein
MANNQPPNQSQTVDELQSIQANLFTITDQYKEWNKQANIYNFNTRDTIHKTTELNKLISKSLDITAKIGKELVNRKTVRRLVNQLEAESVKLAKSYQTTYDKLTKSQQKQIDLLGQQQDQYRSLTKQFDEMDSELTESRHMQNQSFERLLDLEAQGLQNSQQFIDLEKELDFYSKQIVDTEKQKVSLGTKIESLNESIAKAYKNQAISSALVQRTQMQAAKDVLKTTRSLPQEVEKSNKVLRKRNFLQEAFSRVPILKDAKMLPKHIEDFGVKGTLALGVIGLIAASIAKIVQLMFKADTQITEIQKGFSVSRESAKELRQSFYEIANNASKFADIQEGTLITEQDIFNTQMQFNDAFGTAIALSGQQVVQLTKIKDLIGISEEGWKNIMTYSLQSGKSVENIDRTVLGTSRIIQAQSGVLLNNKDILDTVLKVSGGIRANFRGNVEQLAKAVTQAKIYGTTLEKVQQTSESLLDFETSIESQLEAELLVGRKINLERARAAALNGDMVTVMNEMVKQAGDFDHFMKYNVIQQQSLAKAFGYSRDEMSDMLFQQKAIEGLRKLGNNAEKKSLSERYEQLIKEGKSREQLEQILGAETEQRLATQSAQERFNKSLQKLEDIFSRLFEGGIIQKAINGLASVVEHLSSGGSLFGILSNSESYQAAKARVGSQIGKIQDGVISPQGTIMISTPKGQIATNPGDSVIATTNPSSVLGGGNGSANTKALESKMDKIIDLLSKGGNVYMDGRKVGTTMALGYNATA